MSRPRKPGRQTSHKTFSFRLPQELVDRLRSLAERNRRTISGEVHLALEGHLVQQRESRGPLPEPGARGEV